jgi:acetyl esterase/lipase
MPISLPFTRRSVLAVGSTALLSACAAGLDALVPRGTYDSRGSFGYGALPRQQLDVYLPLQKTAGMPVVVFFYGGAWTRGDRDGYRFVGEALASQGIAAVVADYRLSPEVRWQEILGDCALATRWVFDNATAMGWDPRKVFLMGHSAGAYNAAMLALDARWLAAQRLQPRQLAGWIGIAGPYDFLPIGDKDTRVAFDWPGTPRDSQPVHHASAQAPRTLLLAAAADRTVDPQRSTVGLGERLRAAGAPVRVQLFDKVSHVTVVGALAKPLRGLAPVHEEIVRFVAG